MAFPSDKKLKEMREKLKKVEGSLALKPDATALEKFRWELCQKFLKFKREKGLSQKELAKMIFTDESKMSKILHHRIEEFSTDRLVTFYQMIDPDIELSLIHI